ncbi:hypothetical protein Leryth_023669 [Lithospermum erythrorhizon]|nr:hypothetical protein Leryth_023669 [Lithospermum erythrorhizon]
MTMTNRSHVVDDANMASSSPRPPLVIVEEEELRDQDCLVRNLEAGVVEGNHDQDDDFSDPFDIANTKNAPRESLKRWRQAALVLNASRRFRYTLDLKRDDETEQRRRMIRAHAQVIRAALLFKLAGQRAIVLGTTVAPQLLVIMGGLEQLHFHNRDHNTTALEKYGGASRSSIFHVNYGQMFLIPY